MTAIADGTRIKPFIAFGGAKCECNSLNEELKSKWVIASPNAWINKEFVQVFVDFPSTTDRYLGIHSAFT